MLAAREPLSFSWMNVIPNSSLGTCIDDVTVSTAVGLRLSAPICHPHVCAGCQQPVMRDGHHALSCLFSKGRWFRHTMINREIAGSLSKAMISNQREPSGTHLDPHIRPDGISIVPWSHGNFLAWDLTVADTLAPSYLTATSLRAGAAALLLEKNKQLKYKDTLPQYTFIGIGLETLGPAGPCAKRFFSDLERRMETSNSESREFTFLQQRISMIIVRSNAISLLGTMANGSQTTG